MAKDKTLWQLILDIFAYIFSRKKRIQAKQQKKLKQVVKDLDEDFEKVNSDKEKSRRKIKDVQDVSDRLNNRF